MQQFKIGDKVIVCEASQMNATIISDVKRFKVEVEFERPYYNSKFQLIHRKMVDIGYLRKRNED